MNRILRTRAAAKLLGISDCTIRLYARAGMIPHRRAGKTLFFSEEKLRAWAAGSARGEGERHE